MERKEGGELFAVEVDGRGSPSATTPPTSRRLLSSPYLPSQSLSAVDTLQTEQRGREEEEERKRKRRGRGRGGEEEEEGKRKRRGGERSDRCSGMEVVVQAGHKCPRRL